MKTKSGHVIERSSEEENKIYKKYFPFNDNGYIRLQPGGWFFHPKFELFADKIYQFQYKPTDVVVLTWPKCGTTWTQEIIWTMTNNPNFDNPLESKPLIQRSAFLEFDGIINPNPSPNSSLKNIVNNRLEWFNRVCPGKDPKNGMFLQMAESLPEPRIIKTHLAFSLQNPKLLDTCKVVYVARNPKDACLSYFHHFKLIASSNFSGSLDEFIDFFIKDKLFQSPYWAQVKEAWDRKEHPNLHWIYYKDMKTDPKKELEKLNNFLSTNLPEHTINNILEYTKFENMKRRDPMFGSYKVNDDNLMYRKEHLIKEGSFFRKGIVGDWKNRFSEDQNNKLNNWIKEKSEGIGIEFTY